MSGATTPVNILLHGLFFMRLNPSDNNLEVLAPVIKDHHFVEGPRGDRHEITGPFKLIDRTNLTGKQSKPEPDKDIPGSVFQFSRTDTDITVFTGDLSNFKGMIVLPWPQAFYSLRTDDIAKSFPYVRTSKVGASIESNAKGKGSSKLGAITLLQYTLPGAGALQNIHYYNEPCKPEDVNAVNADFKEAVKCFKPNDKVFDLQLRTDVAILPVDPSSDEELALYEDPSPDALAICPLSLRVKIQANGDPGTSPANCPNIFVG